MEVPISRINFFSFAFTFFPKSEKKARSCFSKSTNGILVFSFLRILVKRNNCFSMSPFPLSSINCSENRIKYLVSSSSAPILFSRTPILLCKKVSISVSISKLRLKSNSLAKERIIRWTNLSIVKILKSPY